MNEFNKLNNMSKNSILPNIKLDKSGNYKQNNFDEH